MAMNQNYENRLHQFCLHQFHNPSYRRMRINDSGPEYATLGYCQDSGVVRRLLRLGSSRKRHSILQRPSASFHDLWSRRWWNGRPKDLCTGKVYNLNRLSDFSGTYHGISRGLTLIEGKMHAKLTNGNGVVMYLAGETEGLASSIGAQAFEVSLAD